ncbi:hypothetical protein [Deinococcus multiflagellatus]|uniref:Uncharacterized protein n=2 Tax=Deinococcus multiflagellatus TaxID=1656887 RepID=A0ABW1ZV89_9DEIO
MTLRFITRISLTGLILLGLAGAWQLDLGAMRVDAARNLTVPCAQPQVALVPFTCTVHPPTVSDWTVTMTASWHCVTDERHLGLRADDGTPLTRTYSVRPGETITTPEGVKVTTPTKWRDASATTAQITVSRVSAADLPVPLDAEYSPNVIPLYRVQASEALVSGKGAFSISVPTGSYAREYLMPVKLQEIFDLHGAEDAAADEDSPSLLIRIWRKDQVAVVTENAITFSTSVLDDIFFTGYRLSDPIPYGDSGTQAVPETPLRSQALGGFSVVCGADVRV